MSIVVKDGGVDKTNLVNFQLLSIQNNLFSAADVCFFEYEKYGDRTYVPAGGNEIGIWDGATKIFGGKIIKVKKSIVGMKLLYEVECKDWVDTLDGELVTETYENMTVNAIIADIKANYATAFDITNVACTTVIEKIDFAAMPVSKCLDKLAKITGYRWYVDPDKKIYFFVDGTLQSPYDLTDTNGKCISQSLRIKEDFSQIKNRVNLQGGSIANVQVSDATSISTYGEHEVIERDDTLTSTDEATQKANAILTAYKDPIKSGKFETYEAGLKAGQEININSTLRSVNQDFIIQSVFFTARTPNDFEYEVEVMTQPDRSLMEFLQNQAMQPAPTPDLGNTQFSTNIKFTVDNYHQISWTAGTIIMSDGKEYSIASGLQAFSGTNIIYFKPTTSETVLQFSATLANGMGSDRIAIGYCVENSNVALGAQMIPVGYHGGIRAWGGENIVARTVVADQIGLNSLVSNLVTTGEFITLAAQIKNAIIQDAHITGVISVGHTAAKCTDPNADQTSVNTAADTAKVQGYTIISGGYIATAYLTANNITAGTMNAARINGGDINGVTITGVTITGGTLQTSTSGKRVVITSDEISMYNSAGSLSGKIYAVGTEVQGGPWIFHSDKTYITNDLRITGTFSLHGSGDRTMYLRTATATPSWIVASGSSPYDVQINRTFKPYGTCNLGSSSNGWNYLYFGSSGKYLRHDGSTFRINSSLVPTSSTLALGSSSYKWNTLYMNAGASIYWSGTSYYFKHDGTDFVISDTIRPSVANSRYCGTSSYYWHRVYSDSYWTKNTTFQTFDKYDDLQILRDLIFDKVGKLVLSNLPKEIHDKDFINFGGLASFNLCASKKIVECIDDLKKQIDLLKLKITKLESGVI